MQQERKTGQSGLLRHAKDHNSCAHAHLQAHMGIKSSDSVQTGPSCRDAGTKEVWRPVGLTIATMRKLLCPSVMKVVN